MSLQQQVADSWRCGKARRKGSGHATMWTDGKTVWSYAHIIGQTVGEEKVAIDCHFSPTTTRHCNALKAVADRVTGCTACKERTNHGRDVS